MKTIEPLQLQRLIDGRLADREISDIVRDAQQHPQMWQQIGSAFVEDRVFRTAIGQFAEEPAPPSREVGLAKKSDPPAATAPFSGKLRGLVMAALLLIALTAGLIGGWYFSSMQGAVRLADVPADDSPRLSAADNGLTPDESAQQPEMNPVNYEPDYHLQLQNADGSEMLDSEVPLYTLGNARRIGYSLDQNRVPDELVSRAIDSGYDLDQSLHYISGTLSDGRRFIVPVRTVHLSSGQ